MFIPNSSKYHQNLINKQRGIEKGFSNDVNDKLLFRIGMGYTDRNTPDIESVIAWSEEFNNMSHQYSYDTVLYEYGYYDLHKYFGTVQEYLDTPNHLKNMVIKHTLKGKEEADRERAKLAEEAAKKAKREAEEEARKVNGKQPTMPLPPNLDNLEY